jgi:predicted amidohydrolase
MKRRSFLKSTAMGIASYASVGLTSPRAEVLPDKQGTWTETVSENGADTKIGRPVRIVSIGFPVKRPLPLNELVEHVDAEGSRGIDLVILPETCQGQQDKTEEPLQGPTVKAMAALASKHHTYIAVPIDLQTRDRRLNTIAFLDRDGQVTCLYNKIFPYWSEFDLQPSVSPGESAEVYHADFGRVGFATCFDVNFPEVWRSLSNKGAEVVVWPSAYSAGMSLQAHAINHHYYIVTSTQVPDCIVYDITGEMLLHNAVKDINTSRITLDLDRAVYHENFNIQKRDKLLKEHAEDVMQEKWLEREQWFVLRAKRPGVSARTLAKDYGLEEVRQYIERSRLEIDKMRGWKFAEKA